MTTILRKIAGTSVDGVAVLVYGQNFGAQSFRWVALGAIFEAIEEDGASIKRFRSRS